jgi:hypothetical protein
MTTFWLMNEIDGARDVASPSMEPGLISGFGVVRWIRFVSLHVYVFVIGHSASVCYVQTDEPVFYNLFVKLSN